MKSHQGKDPRGNLGVWEVKNRKETEPAPPTLNPATGNCLQVEASLNAHPGFLEPLGLSQ